MSGGSENESSNIEEVKTAVQQTDIMRQGILQFWFSKLDITKVIQYQTFGNAGHIGKLIPHIIP